MSAQLDLFASIGPVLQRKPVEPSGHICTDDEVNERIILRGRRVSLEIELARDGPHWIFSTSFHGPTGGYCYRVGRKWGKSADSRADALHFARKEIMIRSASHNGFSEVSGLLEKLQ